MESYQELAPLELLARSLGAAPSGPLGPTVTRWDRLGREAAEELVVNALPEVVELCTSGSTGPAAPWRHSGRQLWTEAGMLADLVRADRPRAILSFAPPTHLYGLIATALLPAVLGLPLCYWPRYGLPAPAIDADRWLVVAIPWAFPVLLRDQSVLGRREHVTVLHSTATLPATAGEFISAARPGGVRLIELFGSTETGAIAYREQADEPSPWTLMDDVRFTDDPGDARLGVTSPRLALTPEGRPMTRWTTDDYVQRLDDRSFHFHGRRHRLIKVNGRRIDLDLVEEQLRAALPCADLTCVPVTDRIRGEHVELLVAGPDEPHLVHRRTAETLRALGVTVGRITIVDAIDRSDTGKPRRIADRRAVSP
ncbi:AMP-binding protein [Streptomyces albireticuli]|uniref:Acetyl-CoA synthetase n=1 Tax=Streptomyces albireticuli TaxID=1940 RepID=A0A2A2DEN9_9ACTN|nr:AMP-binding protein [Streptomyces albireticuli]MCD9194708.1 AMP-binding protein [Streptomyces albireticuli]PAU49917.1 acetyl-CoA synthetase [Streptomyces albireticuli]